MYLMTWIDHPNIEVKNFPIYNFSVSNSNTIWSTLQKTSLIDFENLLKMHKGTQMTFRLAYKMNWKGSNG